MHWAKDCKSKFDIERKPIPGNSKQGTPQVPFNKNQGQILSFASNPQHPAMLPSIYQPQMIFSFTLKQSLLKYLPDFLDPCPHKPLVFYLANLLWHVKELLFTLEWLTQIIKERFKCWWHLRFFGNSKRGTKLLNYFFCLTFLLTSLIMYWCKYFLVLSERSK